MKVLQVVLQRFYGLIKEAFHNESEDFNGS